MPVSRVAAAWSLGELSWPETEGLEKALGTVPHDPCFLCGFLLQEVAGGGLEARRGSEEAGPWVSALRPLPEGASLPPPLPPAAAQGDGGSATRHPWPAPPPRLQGPCGSLLPLLASPRQDVVLLTADSCLPP